MTQTQRATPCNGPWGLQMGDLVLGPNLPDPDDIYAALLAAHEGLTTQQSTALNARLVLILMNQIGDKDAVLQAIAAASSSGKGEAVP